jgi:uncharacterized protein (DUF486 family)
MLPYLLSAIVIIGLPTIYIAVRYREYRKFLAGAFFVSSGMQLYFYAAKIPIPLIGTNAVQSPRLSGVRGIIHFLLFLVCLYFGWFFKPSRPSTSERKLS